LITDPHPVPRFGDLLFPSPRQQNVTLLNDAALLLTYNGRGAIFQACREIARRGKRGTILMPAFHCPSGITPAINAGLKPVFYRIRRDLTIDFDDLCSKVDHETAAVLVIHYFGRVTDLTPLDPIRKSGVVLIEDCSHSFLQVNPLRLSGGDADFRIYSFWKLLPSGVGGGLWRRVRNESPDGSARRPPPPWRDRLIRSKRMFEEALAHSELKRTRWAFEKLEAVRLAARRPKRELLDVTIDRELLGEVRHPFDQTLADCDIPGAARRILYGSDLTDVAHRRRTNYQQYGEKLSSDGQLQVLFPALEADTCPWIFPVLLQRRDQIDHRWRAAGVALHTFGIHLHSALLRCADHQTVSDALYLANNLLCLSVHQNLEEHQIASSASKILRYLAGNESWANGTD
jgi:perosamine synthetase